LETFAADLQLLLTPDEWKERPSRLELQSQLPKLKREKPERTGFTPRFCRWFYIGYTRI
jgi:hypothetical protein